MLSEHAKHLHLQVLEHDTTTNIHCTRNRMVQMCLDSAEIREVIAKGSMAIETLSNTFTGVLAEKIESMGSKKRCGTNTSW